MMLVANGVQAASLGGHVRGYWLTILPGQHVCRIETGSDKETKTIFDTEQSES